MLVGYIKPLQVFFLNVSSRISNIVGLNMLTIASNFMVIFNLTMKNCEVRSVVVLGAGGCKDHTICKEDGEVKYCILKRVNM